MHCGTCICPTYVTSLLKVGCHVKVCRAASYEQRVTFALFSLQGPKRVDTFSFHTVIVLHALVFGFFVVYLVAGHHWSDGVISENRLAEVKDQMAGLPFSCAPYLALMREFSCACACKFSEPLTTQSIEQICRSIQRSFSSLVLCHLSLSPTCRPKVLLDWA